MFNPWLAFSLNAFQMGVEAQSVIALRMLRFASGNARSETEATRMVTEKIAAAAEAQAVAAMATISGHPQHVVANKALKVFKKRVRANKRRLTANRSTPSPSTVSSISFSRNAANIVASPTPFAMRRERSQPQAATKCPN